MVDLIREKPVGQSSVTYPANYLARLGRREGKLSAWLLRLRIRILGF